MHCVLFYHSLLSDWNHGNAHFLRGVAAELLARGHEVTVYEPVNGWSLANLMADQGAEPVAEFHHYYPTLESRFYDPDNLDLGCILDDADLVIAHEWNPPALLSTLGRARRDNPRLRLLFHDTHHRAVSDPDSLAALDLSHYDGVLAFGNVIRDLYLERGWARQAWTWHEAADTRVFYPRPPDPEVDLVWIGNWGDEERSRELHDFLIGPARALGLTARVHGVRYPDDARAALAAAGMDHRGWLPNYRVPGVFARARVTVHVPRRWYTRRLPGIPTIRPFEALACGIPLICAPWEDSEKLFTPGQDYLMAADGAAMERHLRAVLADREMAIELAAHGLSTLLARHTCAHRVDELLAICRKLGLPTAPANLKEH